MKEFVRENKKTILTATIFTMALYVIKMLCYSVSIDTETFLLEPDKVLQSWYRLGRFGLCFLKEALPLIPIHIRFANIMTVLWMILAAIAWLYNFCRLKTHNNPMANLAFMLIITTSPILAEQFSFTLQSMEVAFTFFVEAVGMILTNRWIEGKGWYNGLLGVAAVAFSFSCYQSFVFLYICCSILCYLARREELNGDSKDEWKLVLRYIIIFAVSFVLYECVDTLVKSVMGLNTVDAYLSSQIFWGKEPLRWTVERIWGYVRETLLGQGASYHPFLPVLYIAFLFVLYKEAQKGKKVTWICIAAMLGLAGLPFVLPVLTGNEVVFRSQFSLPFMLAYFAWFLMDWESSKVFCRGIKVCVVLMMAAQTAATFVLQYSALNSYNRDVEFAGKIHEELLKMGTDGKKVVFTGFYNTNELPRGETMGYSFFEWDAGTPVGSNFRIHDFMETLGMDYTAPEVSDVEKAKKLTEGFPTWEEKPVIYEADDLLMIKLSK